MSVKDQMIKAKAAIQTKDYDRALELLDKIDHPKAREWETMVFDKLSESTPRKNSAQSGVPGWAIPAAIAVLTLVIGFLGGVVTAGGTSEAEPKTELVFFDLEFCIPGEWGEYSTESSDAYIDALLDSDVDEAVRIIEEYTNTPIPDCETAQRIYTNFVSGWEDIATYYAGNAGDDTLESGFDKVTTAHDLTRGYSYAAEEALNQYAAYLESVRSQ